MRPPIVIIGVDPGTTVGIAVLDIRGSLIHIDSMRSPHLQDIITKLTDHGRPLIIGTDKAKPPELILKLSAKLGARIIAPNEDLLVIEKKDLIKGHIFKDSHQADALAAAIYAHKKVEHLLARISSYLEHEGRSKMMDEVSSIMLTKEGIAIKDALNSVEEMHRPPRWIEPPKVMISRPPTLVEHQNLREKIRGLELENRTLKHTLSVHSEIIGRQGKRLTNQTERLSTMMTDKKAEKILFFRDKRLKDLQKKIEMLNARYQRLRFFLSKMGEMMLVKRLSNLTLQEYQKKAGPLNIRQDDILLVDDTNAYSIKTMSALRGKVILILFKGKLNPELGREKDFIFLDSKSIRTIEQDDFALVNADEFETLKSKKNLLFDLVEKYRESRKKEMV
jgi:uncharacterized protein